MIYKKKKDTKYPIRPWTPRLPENKMTMVWGTVKAKHWKVAQDAITELIKPWR